MLVYGILSVLNKLIIHQFTLVVVVFDEHQIDGSGVGVARLAIVFGLDDIELVATAFGKRPTFSGLHLVGDFLNALQIFGLTLRILVRASIGLDFVP